MFCQTLKSVEECPAAKLFIFACVAGSQAVQTKKNPSVLQYPVDGLPTAVERIVFLFHPQVTTGILSFIPRGVRVGQRITLFGEVHKVHDFSSYVVTNLFNPDLAVHGENISSGHSACLTRPLCRTSCNCIPFLFCTIRWQIDFLIHKPSSGMVGQMMLRVYIAKASNPRESVSVADLRRHKNMFEFIKMHF